MTVGATHRSRLLRIIILVVILLLAGLYIGFPAIMAVAAVLPDQTPSGATPEGFRDIHLLSDGIQLAGWYATPENGAVIIVVHGAGGGRSGVRSYATMLHAHGYGVLALNMRGYGDSQGRINRLGWTGTEDVGAAITFLTEQPEVETIGGLGLSMGGEILLGAAASYPTLQAIVADGATFRAVDDYVSLPANRPLYRNFTQQVFTFMVGLFSGEHQPQPTLLQSIEQAETTAFLFIAAGNEPDEVAYNSLFHEAARDRSQLWIIPDVGHTGGFDHVPGLYEERITDFFDAELLAP